MLVLRFDYIVIECVCDVLDIIIVITMMISSCILYSASAEKKPYKLQTTAELQQLGDSPETLIESRAGQTATFVR